MADDELAMRIATLAGQTRALLEMVPYPRHEVIEANGRAYSALLALLREHSLNGLKVDVRLCEAHLFAFTDIGVAGMKSCPDCAYTERYGCYACGGGNGNVAAPEDCEVRQIIVREIGGNDSGHGS